MTADLGLVPAGFIRVGSAQSRRAMLHGTTADLTPVPAGFIKIGSAQSHRSGRECRLWPHNLKMTAFTASASGPKYGSSMIGNTRS